MSDKIKKINLNHSFIFFLAVNIFSIIFFRFDNFDISTFLCLFLILTIGVSHGSLDHVKGKKLLELFNIQKSYIFYLIYILIALGIIIIWVLFPTITLILFLIVASYHFGKEDTEFLVTDKSYFTEILYFLKGLLIILAPLYFHFQDTVEIFKILLVKNEFFYSTLSFVEKNKIIQIGIFMSSLSSIFFFINKFEIRKFSIFLDYFSIVILNYYLSPLIAFTFYFCFLHSIRHSITLALELHEDNLFNGFKIFIKKAIPLTILTGVFSLICLYLLNSENNLNSSVLKVIFIGLASLTFPHILLEYLLEKNEK